MLPSNTSLPISILWQIYQQDPNPIMAYPNARGWDDSGNDVHVTLRPGDTYRHGGIEYAHDELPINNTRDKGSAPQIYKRPATGSTSRPSEPPRRSTSERQTNRQASQGRREEIFDRLPPRPRYTEEDELREFYATRLPRTRAANNTRGRQPFSSPRRDTNVSRRPQPFSSPPRNRNVSRCRQPFSFSSWESEFVLPLRSDGDEFDRRFGRHDSALLPLRSDGDEFDRHFGRSEPRPRRDNGPRCCKHGSGYRRRESDFDTRVPRDLFEARFGTDYDPRVPRDAFERRFGP